MADQDEKPKSALPSSVVFDSEVVQNCIKAMRASSQELMAGSEWRSVAGALSSRVLPLFPPAFGTGTSQQVSDLQKAISELRQKYNQAVADLKAERGGHEALQAKFEEQARVLGEMQEKQRLVFLLSSVDESIHPQLLAAEPVKKAFLDGDVHHAFVMSVDIRRSTELMLKAREPQRYADFLTCLCDTLTAIVKKSYGVFDKFTGDGILAFYPDFFSGPEAGLRALRAARDCHRTFKDLYREYRSCFNSILTDIGLGIGIDYGPVHLVRVSNGITVVGGAVVYACRMGGALAGKTYLNQPAYEQLSTTPAAHYSFQETTTEIKHEGPTLAYEVIDTGTAPQLDPPAWLQQEPAAAGAPAPQAEAAAAT